MRFTVDEDDNKYNKCIFCNNILDLSQFRGKYVCKHCQDELSKDFKLNFFTVAEYLENNTVKEKVKELEIQKRKSSLDLVILASLIEIPQYAGELEKNIKSKDIFKNKEIIDFPASSVYQKVKDLEKKGYIESEESTIVTKNYERRDVREYSITQKGKEYFHKALCEKIKGSLGNCIIRFNSTIYLMDYIENNERLKYLDNIKSLILREIEDIKNEGFSDGYTDRIMYNQKRCILDALLQWVIESEFDIRIEEEQGKLY